MFALTGRATTLQKVVAQAVSTVALVLLAASGVTKLLDPDPTTGAMTAARLPSSRRVSRGLGLLELAAAGAGLVLAGVWPVVGATLYTGFFLFTLVALHRRLPIQSCGCFGREDTPPTVLHVGFNAISAAALAYLAVLAAPAVPWTGPPAEVALYLAFGLIGAYLSYLVLAQLPRTLHMTSNS